MSLEYPTLVSGDLHDQNFEQDTRLGELNLIVCSHTLSVSRNHVFRRNYFTPKLPKTEVNLVLLNQAILFTNQPG